MVNSPADDSHGACVCGAFKIENIQAVLTCAGIITSRSSSWRTNEVPGDKPEQIQEGLEETIENDKQHMDLAPGTDQQGGDANKHKHVQLPLTRVRMMIRSDPDVNIVGQEALIEADTCIPLRDELAFLEGTNYQYI